MRSIPASLAARVRAMQQTRGNNCDPRLYAIISRHTVPILNYAMWQTTVLPDVEPSRVSVAAQRPDVRTGPTAVYIGAIVDGVAKIYTGALSGATPSAALTLAATLTAGAIDIAVALEGRFMAYRGKTEFITTGNLRAFVVLTGGNVVEYVLGGGSQTLANSAVAVSAIMGPGAALGDVSAGLVLAWATDTGAVLTRQYHAETWESAVLCTAAPENVTDIALSRTWDYRVAMQLKTSDGKIWQMLGRSMISGNANVEQLQVTGVDLTVDVNETIPHDFAHTEHVDVHVGIEAGAYSIIAPTVVSAENLDDGAGNWGHLLRVRMSGPTYDLTGNAGAFVLAGVYAGEAIAYDPADPDNMTLLVTMADFNNAPAETALTYTPGTLASGPSMTLVEAAEIDVELTGLVPNEPPEPISAEALDNYTIDIHFSEPLSSADIGANTAAFTVSGYEPTYSPGGTLTAKTYTINSVVFAPEAENDVVIDLTDGTFDDLEVT